MKLLAIILLSGPLFATHTCTVCYISTGGSDSNTGTSTSVPWAHAPGMASATGNAASQVPVAGDSYILRGGDTWVNSDTTWTLSVSGGVGNRIYYGVDKTWYTGASWTKPVIDLQSTSAGVNNRVFDLTGSHIVVDNFEVINFRWTGTPAYGTTIGYRIVGLDVQVDNQYFHAWTHDTPGGCTGGTCDVLKVVVGSTSTPFIAGSVIDNLTCDGAPSGTDSGMCTYAVPTVINSTAHNMSNGFLFNGSTVTIANNVVSSINVSYDASQHENCYESTGSATVYFYNNIAHGCTATSISLGGAAETDYVYNNVVYGSVPVPLAIDPYVSVGSAYIYNNTFQTPTVGACIRLIQRSTGDMTVVDVRDNLCISDTTNTTQAMLCDSSWNPSQCTGAITKTVSSNDVITNAVATTQGYVSSGTAYAPTSPAGSTIGAGANLTSLGIATLNADKLGIPRPASGAWDAGAYEYIGTSMATGAMTGTQH